MGFSDVFVAPMQAVDDSLAETGPRGVFPMIEWKGIDNVKVATLTGILTGRDHTDLSEGGEFGRLLDESADVAEADHKEGPWIFQFPDSAVAALKDATDEEFRDVAARWAATDELQADQWSREDAETFLREVQGLTRRADDADQHLYVWLTL